MHKQAEHYKKIHETYQNHYFDRYSRYYRKKIIFNKIIKFIETSNSTLDIGCGGPENYFELKKISKKIKVYHGVDISKDAVDLFKEKTLNKNSAFVADFSSKKLKIKKKYDCLLFLGSLHHMTRNLEGVIHNCSKFLKKNGILILVEPNAAFLNSIRNLWYRLSDDFDHENERALSIEEINCLCKKNNFSNLYLKFTGNIGFYVILNSMILKIPKWIKRITYKPLIFFDQFFEKLNLKYASAIHISVWKKN